MGELHVQPVGEAFQPWNLAAVHVVVDAGAVPHEIEQQQDDVLGHVRDRNHQRRDGLARAPGVVPLHVGHRGGDVQPTIGQPDDTRPLRPDPDVEIGLASLRCRRHVARGQETDAAVVGEKNAKVAMHIRLGRRSTAGR